MPGLLSLDMLKQEVTAGRIDTVVVAMTDMAGQLIGKRFQEECTPGYYNNEGKPEKGFGLAGELYGGGPVEFHEIIRRWRADGEMKGLRFT